MSFTHDGFWRGLPKLPVQGMAVAEPIPRSEREPSVWELCAPTSEQRAAAKAAARNTRPDRDSVLGEKATLGGDLSRVVIQAVGEHFDQFGAFEPCCHGAFDGRGGIASRLREFLLREMESQAADAMLGLPDFLKV
ncbi:MAG TPA: hypothetical protein VK145_00200 [Candidatus Nanoarchaeia archaeon]|nr:hypothetical protein [Candidatus Nanoarchaeia archaeon]